jgi:hypothetical protein
MPEAAHRRRARKTLFGGIMNGPQLFGFRQTVTARDPLWILLDE